MTHWISNQWVEGEGEHFASVTPYRGDLIWSGRAASEKQVDVAVRTARQAFSSWRKQPFEAREAILLRYAALVKEKQELIAESISKETGKPLWETKTEAAALANKVAASTRAYVERTPTTTSAMAEHQVTLRHRPLGVMAVFGPYNFPCHLPNGHIIPALLAGNTIVFKPSEQTPFTGELLVKLFHEAGVPSGVLNLVQGAKETGVALAKHPQIDGLLFTGSAGTGHRLHEQFGGHPEKMLALEMGGNNPLVVSKEHGDLDAAVYTIIQSAFLSAGQRCTCARRLYVHESSSALIERLCDVVRHIKIDQPFAEPAPFMGPLISTQAVETILKAQAALTHQGAIQLVTAKAGDIAFVTPAILDVTDVPSLPDEEYFGPLLQIIRYQNFSQAVEMANDTAYGLSAGLISVNRREWDYFSEEIRAGIVNWNRPLTGASSEMPFGGPGASGNFRPSALYAADYCAYPMASMEAEQPVKPTSSLPGIKM